jgi:hypothetical protein
MKIDPRKFAVQKVERLKKDMYAIIWIAMIAALVGMTFFAKLYVRDMMVISILFVLFWYLEPFLYGMHGKSITALLSRGHSVPRWKRFPIFFLEIILLYAIYSGLQSALESAFPAGSVNIVIVGLWLGFLFLLWVYKFSKE